MIQLKGSSSYLAPECRELILTTCGNAAASVTLATLSETWSETRCELSAEIEPEALEAEQSKSRMASESVYTESLSGWRRPVIRTLITYT